MKEDDFFVCECCSTKYRLEEMKVMFNGPIDITGSTVKYDNSDEIKNYKILANRHFSNREYEEAQKYYKILIIHNPNDYDSVLKEELCSAYSRSIYDYDAQKLYIPLKNVFEILSDKSDDEAITYRKYALIQTITYMESDVGDSVSKAKTSIDSLGAASKELMECISLSSAIIDLLEEKKIEELYQDELKKINTLVSSWVPLILEMCEKNTSYYTKENNKETNNPSTSHDIANKMFKAYQDASTDLYLTFSSIRKINNISIDEKNNLLKDLAKKGIQYHSRVSYNFLYDNMRKWFYLDDECRAEYAKQYDEMVNFMKTIDESYEAPIFKKQYVVPKNGGCYIATSIYGSYDCPQVWTLRRYRDNVLDSTYCGRLFIRFYYAVSPTIVRLFGHTRLFKVIFKPYLDRKVKKLRSLGYEDSPYKDKY